MTDEPTTLAALIEAQAEALGDRPFFQMGDRRISFAGFNQQVNQAANGLAGLGVERGVEFRDALPKTGTHRIQKSSLKREGVGPDTWDRESH